MPPGAEVETQSKALNALLRYCVSMILNANPGDGKSRRHRATKSQAEAKQGK